MRRSVPSVEPWPWPQINGTSSPRAGAFPGSSASGRRDRHRGSRSGPTPDLQNFDPEERWTIRAAEQRSRVDYSLFEGFEVQGRVKQTFLRGQLIVGSEELVRVVGFGIAPGRGLKA